MKTITVNKKDLLDKLRENRDGHRATYEEAVEAYRAKAIEVFEQNIREVREGKPVRQYLELPVPEDHTSDYERVIAMLEWDEGEKVELTESEFRQYVQDNWGWAQSFMANTMSYTSDGSP